ncbi:B12-binding domain-containing radical SAM protein [Desulfosudis oleivorans]|uniref:Radical SAM domain protein n=1 Tax=Desulfosudis oleivorans (strain DSM 6200 / JCM 39069 / Hxd3) TaxID=96561 RepID=A8ZWV0_DESOH|nr:radical SAM protein [Desulfosudis oleivorans]ABW68431.1 Radical SAM domain protein [Desulfosudis oleivorans Hxd3]
MNRSRTDALLISLQVDLDTIGLKQIHAVLQDRGFSSLLLYLPSFSPGDNVLMEQVVRFVADRNPGFVGISLMSHEFSGAAALTGRLKQAFPCLPVIWGGIHPTIAPEMCLDHADYVCVGEGEHAVAALARAFREEKTVEHISNICYRRQGKIVRNPLEPVIQNLDSLPTCEHLPRGSYIAHRGSIVSLDHHQLKRYGRWRGTIYSTMSSRGCPFACAYCCNDFLSRLYDTRKIRRRSVASLMPELSRAVADHPEIQYINFQDDCFLACSDAYLEAFCHAYRQKIGRPFIVRCIPAFVDAGRLKKLKAAGLVWMSLGLQSGSDRVLSDAYNRHSTSEQFLAAARLVHEAGIAAYYDVILDNPLENDEDRYKTIEVLTAAPRPYFLQLFALTLYPGSSLYERITADSPGLADAYLHKNFYHYRHTSMNKLIRISAYLPVSAVRRLISYGRSRPQSAGFRLTLITAGLLSTLMLEPLAYFRVIQVSQHGSVKRTLKQIPVFFRIGFSRYVKQFSSSLTTIAERWVRDDLISGNQSKNFRR